MVPGEFYFDVYCANVYFHRKKNQMCPEYCYTNFISANVIGFLANYQWDRNIVTHSDT